LDYSKSGATDASAIVSYTVEECGPCCAAPEDFSVNLVNGTCDVEVCIDGYEDCDVQTYIVRYKDSNGVTRQVFNSNNCIILSGLVSGATYDIWTLVRTAECNFTNASATVSYTVEECGPCCAAPEDFTVKQLDGTCDVEVCINGYEDCDVQTYVVRYKDANGVTRQVFNSNNCITLTDLEEGETYDIWTFVRTAECNFTSASAVVSYTVEDCEPSCCFNIDVNYTPTPSCTGIVYCVTPLFAEDEFCEGTIFEFTLCDANQNPITPMAQTTSNCFQYVGLDPCKIYYVKGRVIVEGSCTFAFNSQIRFPSQCCLDDSPTDPVPGPDRTRRADTNEDIADIPVVNISTIKVAVSPNPFNESFDLNFSTLVEGEYEFNLYDTKGGLIRTQNGTAQAGNNQLKVRDLSKVPSGVYIYQLQINGKVYSDRMIKQ